MSSITFEGSEEQSMLLDVCRSIVADVVAPHVQTQLEAPAATSPPERAPERFLHAVGELGLRGVGLPDELGGTPLDLRTQALCLEELARGDAGFATLLAQDWRLNRVISRTTSTATLESWSGRYLADSTLSLATSARRLLGAVAAEHGDGPTSDEAPTARRSDGGWTLTGALHDIDGGAAAGAVIVPAVAEDGASVPLLVPVDDPGVECTARHRQVGRQLTASADMRFRDVQVPDDHALRTDEELAAALDEAVLHALVTESAIAVGIGQALLDACLRHAKEREQGGNLIVTYQAIARLLAEMAADLDGLRAGARQAAEAVEAGEATATRLALTARLRAGDVACRLGRSAMELHGGSGVMREVGVETRYRDAVALRDGLAKDAQWFAIAREVTGRDGYDAPASELDLLAR